MSPRVRRHTTIARRRLSAIAAMTVTTVAATAVISTVAASAAPEGADDTAASPISSATDASGATPVPAAGAAASIPAAADAAAPSHSGHTGSVFATGSLPADQWVAGAAQGFRYTYWSRNSAGQPRLSYGTLFTPKGTAPKGGWPVVGWAPAAAGLADRCSTALTATSPQSTVASKWLADGYAIAATDYAGAGTSGQVDFLDGKAAANNVVDGVHAAHDIVPTLSKSFVSLGISQGSMASLNLATSSMAGQIRASGLDLRASVAIGIPAYLDQLVSTIAPGLPLALPGGATASAVYALAGLDAARPELKVASKMTDAGRRWLTRAKTECSGQLAQEISGVALGSLIDRSMGTEPALLSALRDYLHLPVLGFSTPAMMAQGLADTDVVMPLTLTYLAAVGLPSSEVTVKTYPGTSTSTPLAAQADSAAFVNRFLRAKPPTRH
ncbi:prolyl oligopeptidase family serine peptidase [Gordonia jinhuaensis]|uniref:Lipase n=1 Tax=Gordonia jinhuaensis TaxID=1517702 RepID=A0A916T1J7_9ACTN|nr:lipase family protein [Gordonia jinhuaensis]GGB23653.1 lipase [Gordonia jinhuaensis]